MALFSQTELLQAIREDICGELSAINQYDQHYNSTDNPLAKRVFADIRDEEKVHVGELLTLLMILNPEEAKYLEKGEREVRNLSSTTYD